MQMLNRIVMTAALAALSLAALADSPFLGSKSDPHATLVLNIDQKVQEIRPVEVWSVDGQAANRENQGMLWMKPGDYTLAVKLTKSSATDSWTNAAHVSGSVSNPQNLGPTGIEGKVGNAPASLQQIKISAEAGKVYYIGAKYDKQGNWKPVLWKTEDDKG